MKNCGHKYRRNWELPEYVETLIMVYGKSTLGRLFVNRDVNRLVIFQLSIFYCSRFYFSKIDYCD